MGYIKTGILKYLTKIERNILLTGDPDQEFDPYTYIWIYTYPELAIQNPAIQQNFQHILQFEDNFDLEQNILLDQQDQQRGRSQGSRNQTDSWKNTAAPEWKPPKISFLSKTLTQLHLEPDQSTM